MDSKIRKIIAWGIFIVGFLSAGSVLFFNSHPYVDRRLYEVATGAGAHELNRELLKGIQILSELNNRYSVCTPEMVNGLQAFVDHSPLFYSATISGKGYFKCSVSSSDVRDVTGPALSWDIYSIGINRAQVEKLLGLPFWLSLTVQDSVEDIAERFWKKALVTTVGNSRVYVLLDSAQIWIWPAVFWMCLLLCWILLIAHTPGNEGYKKSDARLIKDLLKNEQVNLHYQPIVDLESGNWIGAEALLRCVDLTTDTYYPAPYIVEIAEHHDHARQLFREVCYQVAWDFNTHFWALDSFYVTINVTSKNLSHPACALHIEEIFKEFDVSPSSIVFEVTETTLISDQTAIDNIFRIKKMGFRIALDDFGTGYCGLQYLEKFPVDLIKLDASFVQRSHSRMVAYAACLAKLKKVKVIAEGIETKEQSHELLEEGIRLGQGWYFAPAMPAAKLVRKCFTHNQRDAVFTPI